jgi:hypothetical protein
MKDAILMELAATWELQADTGGDGLNRLQPAARETLRACADTLRMLAASSPAPAPAASDAPGVPFKPETWPVDADGFERDLCTECGTPVRYGSRHSSCGVKAMAAKAQAAKEMPDNCMAPDCLSSLCASREQCVQAMFAAPAPVLPAGDARSIITHTIGFEFAPGELQSVNADDLLRLAAALSRAGQANSAGDSK